MIGACPRIIFEEGPAPEAERARTPADVKMTLESPQRAVEKPSPRYNPFRLARGVGAPHVEP